VAAGIAKAVELKASVINLSLGSSAEDATMTRAVQNAIQSGVVVVAASGNQPFCSANNTVSSPASIDAVIAVGAVDQNDVYASFTCGGQALDVSAPGVAIFSTTLAGHSYGDTLDGSSADGTSFAAPMVAGVAALLRSLNPTMSVSDVTRYIDFYSDDLGPPGFDTSYGFGRLNAARTLTAAANHVPFITNPIDPGKSFPYPNPFNPTSGGAVTFSLSTGTTQFKIDIYTLNGVHVKTIQGTNEPDGHNNEWNGRNEDGTPVASGLYIYRAETNLGTTKGKITILK